MGVTYKLFIVTVIIRMDAAPRLVAALELTPHLTESEGKYMYSIAALE